MTNIGTLLEAKLLPVASKVASNKVLIAVRDGITLSMPLLIIGSLFMVIASFPVPGWETLLGEWGVSNYLWKGVSSSFGLVALIASFGVAYSYAQNSNLDGVSVGIISLSSFITVTPFVAGETGEGIPLQYAGAQGLFVALFLGVLTAIMYQWFVKRNIQIKMPDAVPPAVSRSFSALIPGAAIITFWLIAFFVLDRFGLPNIHAIIKSVLGGPLGLLGNNIIGVMIVAGLNSMFWFVGLHGGNVVNSLFQPLWIENLDANVAAHLANQPLEKIITLPFMDNFVYMGGGGATIGLVLVIAYLARKKHTSQRTKVMAPLTVTPGLFNINEPTMFGLPVVLNVYLFLPFILAPMVNALITYLAMYTGIVPMTFTTASWTMPPVLSGFLTTGSVAGSILQVVLIIIDVLLYLPFYLMVEKGFRKEELEEN